MNIAVPNTLLALGMVAGGAGYDAVKPEPTELPQATQSAEIQKEIVEVVKVVRHEALGDRIDKSLRVELDKPKDTTNAELARDFKALHAENERLRQKDSKNTGAMKRYQQILKKIRDAQGVSK